ncbi:MAG: MIP family channel protein [Vicinamibacteria bacterium]
MLTGTAREALAEFFGTFILIVFGSAAVAQVVLSGNANGTYISINIAWGMAVTMAIYCSAGVSGAHLNPAVTVALAAHRGFAWSKVVPYCLAQLAGAFAGAAVTYLTYREAFDRFDGGTRMVTGAKATAGIFATYPQDFLSNVPGGLIDQIVGTALLIILVLAIGDNKNFAAEGRLQPILVGAAVVLIGMSFGYNAGYAINPARDLGPRLFTAMAGWGGGVFTAGNGWWWVPIVGPLIGGVLGGFVYDLCITRHQK